MSTLLLLAIGFAYTVCFWVGSSATPGKMAVGVVVTTVDGEPIAFRAAILRYIGYIVSGFVLGIGYLTIAFRRDKRGLHDLMANTVVIRKSHLERYKRSRRPSPNKDTMSGLPPAPWPTQARPW